jgi:hypothetical protein
MVFNGTMPEMLTPLFGTDAKSERRELRIVYPEYITGKRLIIPDADLQGYIYAQAASAHWGDQYELYQNRMRYHLGDAEYGTDFSGRIYVSRRIGPRKGFTVTPGITDSIHVEKG